MATAKLKRKPRLSKIESYKAANINAIKEVQFRLKFCVVAHGHIPGCCCSSYKKGLVSFSLIKRTCQNQNQNQNSCSKGGLTLAIFLVVRSTTPGKCGVHLFSTAIVTMIMSTSSMLGIDGVVPIVECFHDLLSNP